MIIGNILRTTSNLLLFLSSKGSFNEIVSHTYEQNDMLSHNRGRAMTSHLVRKYGYKLKLLPLNQDLNSILKDNYTL